MAQSFNFGMAANDGKAAQILASLKGFELSVSRLIETDQGHVQTLAIRRQIGVRLAPEDPYVRERFKHRQVGRRLPKQYDPSRAQSARNRSDELDIKPIVRSSEIPDDWAGQVADHLRTTSRHQALCEVIKSTRADEHSFRIQRRLGLQQFCDEQ